VVIEQKFMRGDTDYRRQLQVIQDSRVDAIVLWTDVGPAAGILQQMQELGMKQRVFGSHRTLGDELVKLAGAAAEGFEAVYPYDPTRSDPRWIDFVTRYEARFHEKPDHFAALSYDQMQILLQAICRAGLNRGRIRDALTGIENYKGVTGDMVFDPNSKNIAPLFLGTVHKGNVEYRRITMEKLGVVPEKASSSAKKPGAATAPYARVGEDGVSYLGPALADQPTGDLRIGVFGPHAEDVVKSDEVVHALSEIGSAGRRFTLVPISSELSWGKASSELVKSVYEGHVLAVVALDRNSSHLAEQVGVKAFVPVIAIASDRTLTSTNIPWIFRLPGNTPLPQALRCVGAAIAEAGPNRAGIREVLASGRMSSGVRFESTGESTRGESAPGH
jgi:hypothetical protein